MEYAVIAFFFGLSAGVIGRMKGSSFFLWFLVGLVLPILGTIAALLYRWESDQPMRHCEECGAILPIHDQVCMKCGRDLEFPQEILRPANQ
jgi:hypothetical protein